MGIAGAEALVLYDGLCGFCNSTMQWLAKHDHKDRLRFAAQQSAIGKEVLARHGLGPGQEDSIFVVLDYGGPGEKVLLRSDAPVQCQLSLGGVWTGVGRALEIVPKPIRDAGYRLMARNRYRLGARYETCPMPSAAERAKFLGV